MPRRFLLGAARRWRITAELAARAAQRGRRAAWIRAERLSAREAEHIPLSFDPRPHPHG